MMDHTQTELDSYGYDVKMGSRPVRHWIVENFADPIRITDVPAANAPGWEASYDTPGERGKRSTRHLNIVPGALSLYSKLVSPSFVCAIASKMGYAIMPDPTIRGGGIHVMEPGGEIAGHIDADRHGSLKQYCRAATVVVYLSEEWRIGDGGEFSFLDVTGEVLNSIHPLPGRMLLFENGRAALHAVNRVHRGTRISFMMPYLTFARPHNIHTRPLFLPFRGGG